MNKWKLKTLGDVAEIIYGYTEKASFEEIGPKFLRITDIQNNNVNWGSVPFCSANESDYQKYKLREGDIVFARTGATTGKSYLIKNPPKSVFASYLIKVHLNNDELLSEFLYLYFQTSKYWDAINFGMSGSAQGGFNATKLSQMVVPLPPISEQKRIVKILDNAFAAINKAKANAEKNLQNSRELFESYLNKIFANPGEDWVMKQLADICLKTENIRWQENQTTNFLYIDLSSVSRESLSIENSQNINAENAPSRAKKIVKTNDIIFGTTRPTLKRVAKIDAEYNEQICSTGFVILRANSLEIYPEWIFYFLQTSSFIEKMRKIQKGASYPAVTEREVKNELIPIPPLFIQKDEIKRLTSLKKQTKKLETIYKQKLADLEELKKSILQKAFNGEL